MSTVSDLGAFITSMQAIENGTSAEELRVLTARVVGAWQGLEQCGQHLEHLRGVMQHLEARDPLEGARGQLEPLLEHAENLELYAQQVSAASRHREIRAKAAELKKRTELLRATMAALREAPGPTRPDDFMKVVGTTVTKHIAAKNRGQI